MRKLMMAVTAVAGMSLVVTGCSKRDNVESQRQDVAEARMEAQQETAEIRQDAREDIANTQTEAQEDIAGTQREAAEEVASARQDVQEEREDLAEAEADRRADLNDDLALGGSGVAGATAAASSVSGRVLSTGGDELTVVDTRNNKQLELKTNDQTRILHNNQPLKLDDIEEGAQVRASYVQDGEDMVVRELTVTQPVQKKK
ncbi:hypothetical protein HV824_17830 [Myxococcus sp. AM009]|uniref:hypothetical protein n=1 Tax=unclassified Myxococcus TaxID=2648731 RepID=UPI00159543FC|nr:MULTISPECIES: hypothetical protein [unclassified Myxococcus]NVI99970.1 hypothetical protein [Myxococcus sp. AM009]NVJ17185.1 hypothetical protein [Myxococcus sp. AM010]